MKLTARRNEKGALGILFALTIIGLIGFAGLAIDVGYLQWQKRCIQGAADAAAIGALRELERSQTDLVAAGLNDAALNGFVDGRSNTHVTINNPPATGSFVGNTSAVEAIITRTVPTFFMRVFGQNAVTIAGRAVARTSTTQGSIGACIYVMNPTASAALEIGGTNMNLSTSCGVVINSTDPGAFKLDSGVQVNLADHAQVGVVGPGQGSGWVINGQAALVDTTTGNSELPVNIKSFGDPLQKISAPSPSAFGGTQQSIHNIDKNHMPANNTLNPGVYCGGITVQSTPDNTYLVFNPGIYIIAGGGLTINAGAWAKGTGVSFYITTSSSQWGCSGNPNYQPISIAGSAQVKFSAPTGPDSTTGQDLTGILFFEDRNQSGNHNIAGNSDSQYTGAIYLLHSQLQFAGRNSTSGYLVLVSDTLKINGDSTLGNNHQNLETVYTLAPVTTGGGLVE